MKRSTFVGAELLGSLFVLQGCGSMPGTGDGWSTLIEGSSGLDNFNRIGDANWRAEDGTIVADRGAGGFLVTKKSYRDFQIRAEFWADHTTNSGIFLRPQDPAKIDAVNSYEVNIFDQRPKRSTALARSSMSPRWFPCPRPAVSGTSMK